jgi:hypothetical protein
MALRELLEKLLLDGPQCSVDIILKRAEFDSTLAGRMDAPSE